MSEIARAKFHDVSGDEEFLEGSMESRGAENGEYITNSLINMEGMGTVEVLQKGRKIYRNKEKVESVGNHQLDDGGEACSCTEEGLSFSSLKEKVDIEVTNEKLAQFSPTSQRKRSKKLFFGGDHVTKFIYANCLCNIATFISFSSLSLEERSMVLDFCKIDFSFSSTFS